MGDGLVLEQGTHDQLLSKPDGQYSRLVQAQALREQQQQDDINNDSASDIAGKIMTDVDKPIPQPPSPRSPEPLTRRSTCRSVASEMIEKRGLLVEEEDEDLGLFAVVRRLAMLNRAAWGKYGFGIIAACRTYFSR
jgi:ATP-binding cassette, subfamily B (MDR/TAP), member 1